MNLSRNLCGAAIFVTVAAMAVQPTWADSRQTTARRPPRKPHRPREPAAPTCPGEDPKAKEVPEPKPARP